MNNNISYYEKVSAENPTLKYAIACEAIKKCQPKDSVFIDAGTSLTPIAELFVAKSSLFPNLVYNTILTNNYIAFKTLIENLPSDTHLNIMLTGGRYDRNLKALYGSQAKKSLDSFYPAVVFIGLSGLIAEIGLFCQGNTEELDMKEVIFKKGTRDRVIIADISKVGRMDSMCFGTSNLYKANTTGDTYLYCDAPGTNHKYLSEMRILKDIYEVKIEYVKDNTLRLCHKYFTKTKVYIKSPTDGGMESALCFDFFGITYGHNLNIAIDRSKMDITYNYEISEPENAKDSGDTQKDIYVDIFSSDKLDYNPDSPKWLNGDNKSIDKYVEYMDKKMKEPLLPDILDKHKSHKVTYMIFYSLKSEFQPFVIKKYKNSTDLYILDNVYIKIEPNDEWCAKIIKYRNDFEKKYAGNNLWRLHKYIDQLRKTIVENSDRKRQNISEKRMMVNKIYDLMNDVQLTEIVDITIKENITKLFESIKNIRSLVENQDITTDDGNICENQLLQLHEMIKDTNDLIYKADCEIETASTLNKDFRELLNSSLDFLNGV